MIRPTKNKEYHLDLVVNPEDFGLISDTNGLSAAKGVEINPGSLVINSDGGTENVVNIFEYKIYYFILDIG